MLKRTSRRRRSRSTGRRRLGIELLESRQLLSATMFWVQNTNDSGPGSLRAAILAANRSKGLDTIEFAPQLSGSTIALTGGQLPITDNLRIVGPGANELTISGGDQSRIFEVASPGRSTQVAIEGLTLRDGRANGNGGAIENWGKLTLQQCWVTSNTAVGDGGGIANFGSLNVTGSTFSDNTADNGGAIANLVNHRVRQQAPSLVVTDSTVVANVAASPLHNTYYDGQGGGDDGPTINVGPRYGSGGGIFNDGWYGGNHGAVKIDFSTIVANQSNDGGGVYNVPFQGGPVTLSATVVAGNAATGRGSDISGEAQATYCLVQNTDPGVAPGLDGYAQIEGAHNLEGLAADLDPLGFYGGTTPTCPPLSDSPLINNGPLVADTAVDQSGNPRVSGGRADIGAVEELTTSFSFEDGHPAQYVGSHGETVTVSLSGPGTGFVDAPADGGNATELVLNGTTDQSALKVETSGGATTTTTIDSIFVHGDLASIDAACANLVGDMRIDGSLGSLALNDVLTTIPTLLTIGGSAGALSFHDVKGLNVQAGGAIETLSAASWSGLDLGRTSIQVASVGTIAIAGGFRNAMVDSAGDIASVTVGGLMSSVNLYAGVNPGSAPIPDPAVDFVADAMIGAVTAAASASPVVAGRHLGQIDLGSLSDATPDASSGLVADDIASLRLVKADGTTIERTGLDTVDQSEQFGDHFQVTLDAFPSTVQWTFAVTGDDRGKSSQTQVNTKVLKAIASGILRDNVDFVLFIGDIVHWGQASDGQQAFQLWKDTVAAGAADTNHSPVYHLALGNHDFSNTAGPATNYVNAFPTQVYPLGSGDKTDLLFHSSERTRPYAELSYEFIHKNVLFIGLDNYGPKFDARGQYGPIDGHATRRQAGALASLNRRLHGKYTSAVMFGHVPATELLGNSGKNADRVFSEFVRMKGEYYFAGHEHRYQKAEDVTQIPGLKHAIVGTAGAPLNDNYHGGYGYLLVGVSNGQVVDDSLKFKQVD